MPPSPVVVVTRFVHGPVAESLDWTWYERPYAASQLSTTRQMLCVLPRSTWTHCGSEVALDQRVVVLASKALAAGVPAFSVDDADDGLFSAEFTPVLQVVGGGSPAPPKTWNSHS